MSASPVVAVRLRCGPARRSTPLGKKPARPNTYDITITGSLAVVEQLLGTRRAPGAYTPNRA